MPLVEVPPPVPEAAHPAHPLHGDRADPFFPLQVPLRADGLGLVGWLLLGPRPDGSFYGRDERDALEAIADPVARALTVAIARERRAGEQRDRENAIRRDISALQQHVDTLRAFLLDHNGPEPRAARFT